VIYDRCQLKLRRAEGWEDAAHEVYLRLLEELKRGRRYRVPFRVVVHKVIGWKVQEHFQAKRYDAELEEWFLGASSDSEGALESDLGFEAMLQGLTDLEREVIRLHYGDEDLDFGEIARRLDRESNAIHQIHYRALAKLRKDAA
jgi:RNA polymerase sigma factor (sigma-70 family)